MAGDNRTPEKTIGEVRYAELKHAEERQDESRNADKSGIDQQKVAQGNSDQQPPKGGDNRTPDKTIGEVKYAQVRRSSKSGSN